MNILVDTHALIWDLEVNPKISQTAKDMIEDIDYILISIASLWERSMQIKFFA